MNYNEVFQQVDGPVTKPVLPLFSSPEVRSQAVAQATRRPVSAGLLSVLRQGNSFLEPSAAREANLDALAEPGTVAVLTGQQAGLFLGPLFTIYKALSAVAACAALTKECGVRAVPVFWLQTEDHDFEEIRKTFVQDRDSTLIKLELLAAQPDPRCSVEYRILGGEVLQLHEVLREHLGHLPHAPEMLGRLAQCYCPGAALSSAFASFLAYLTARFGLVFFNPRWPGAAKLFQPVYLAAWERREEFAAVLKHQEILLKEHNLVPQVRLVENSPLFFMHNKSGEGARCRLLAQGSHWVLSGTGETASAAEVRAQLEDAPERFSSSALLRPLVQDSIFPSAVYIAGEAEMRYFVQILPLYDA
ncbi:MAG TPA: bacillithiol biosynthesis BshC, partial [Oligoflexia bacterium]|nr:bacillithiol biosynthesis BshC [Oligoflexia bacterium]